MPVNAVHTAARERVQIVRGPSWRFWGRHLWRVSVCVRVLACRCVFVGACVFFVCAVCVCKMQACFPQSADGPVQLDSAVSSLVCTHARMHTNRHAQTLTHTHKHTQGRAWSRCLWNTRPDRYCNGGGKWGMRIELINYCLQCLSIHLSVHPIIDIIKQNYISLL